LAIVAALGTASALVLTEKSPEQKHRKDVAKQLSKYVLCLTKAAQKCEKTGVTTAVECHVDTSVVDPPADPKGKFAPAVAKCIGKVNLAKKSPSQGATPITDYEGIGCPGDSNSGSSGDQRYTDLTAYQAGTLTMIRSQIGAIASGIDAAGCAPGTNHTDQADLDCVALEGLKITTLVKGLFKCGNKCENDYKDKKGNGGTTDGPNCHDGGDPNFQICADAAQAKATKKGPFDPGVEAAILPAVVSALTTADDDIYNQCDCGAGVGPCP
jgi:hypothetical protein